MQTREQAEQDLRNWAINHGRRDDLILAAHLAGISKNRIHTLTGVARTTIDRILEPIMNSNDTARTAARIISAARDGYATNPGTSGGSDAFDFMIATEGIAPFGELYQEAYVIANADQSPVRPGTGQDGLAERKQRAAALWEQVLPELERYAEDCKAAKYTGWSRQSGGPIRRVR